MRGSDDVERRITLGLSTRHSSKPALPQPIIMSTNPRERVLLFRSRCSHTSQQIGPKDWEHVIGDGVPLTHGGIIPFRMPCQAHSPRRPIVNPKVSKSISESQRSGQGAPTDHHHILWIVSHQEVLDQRSQMPLVLKVCRELTALTHIDVV